MKPKKITEKDRKLVADILTQFMFAKSMDDVVEVWNSLFNFYDLKEDPYTKIPVSPEDYYDSKNKYERDTMLEKYGHCDGLE